MKCQAVSIDNKNMIKIMIIMTITIQIDKRGYDNKNNIMKQNDNNITIQQLHMTNNLNNKGLW